MIQFESFSSVTDKAVSSLSSFCDDAGLLRVKSQVSRRADLGNFCYPIILPAKHHVVRSLILDMHKRSLHVGTQGLLSILREKYWVIGGRRTVRSVISKCCLCNRYRATCPDPESPPLPLDRVRDAAVFEVTGVDFAGPLFLKSGEKVWICIFTCAVYRAVHLGLTNSL